MKLIQMPIPDVVLIEPTVYEDERGWFMESFNEAIFHTQLGNLGLPIPHHFVQDNHSHSKKGVLRGLHYQLPPHAQGKLVSVTQGAVFDVVVDIREQSPTFGQTVQVELSAKNKHMLWIPEGFAHGFLALEDNTHFFYKVTDFYNQAHEACLRWDDPVLGINWPKREGAIINSRDSAAPGLLHIQTFPALNVASMPNALIDINPIGDHRGYLVALEKGSNLPFDLKRAYYIFGTKPDVSRGYHAHKKLQQLAVCVAGSCKIVLDNGCSRQDFHLDAPTKGLVINQLVWREMHDFSEDCILIVFASEYYDEKDYIRDYEQFKKEVMGGEKQTISDNRSR